MKLKMICSAVIVALCVAVAGEAAINIAWKGDDGFYKSDVTTPLLNGGATALAQLIFSTDNVADPVNLADPHYVSGNDSWWGDVLVAGNSDYGTFSATYTQSFVSGYYYVRVFDAGSMTAVTQNMWYFNGMINATIDNISEPPQPNEYDIDETTGAFGETLNLQVTAVPEPATWAFMGLGAVVMFLRRRIAK